MLIEMGQKARRAARTLARLTTDQKNATLHCMADALRADQARSAEIEVLLVEKLERWQALEEKARS